MEFQLSLTIYAFCLGTILLLGSYYLWTYYDKGYWASNISQLLEEWSSRTDFSTLVGFLIANWFYSKKNHTVDINLLKRENEITRLNELKIKAELEALTAKTNPHFLYNSLNTIASLAKTNADKTEKMALELSKFLKYSTNRKGRNLVPLEEEIEIIETYLAIEKIRFEEQLSYEVSVEKAAKKELIPRFLLQPLVENALKHGYQIRKEKIQLWVNAKKEADNLIISIADSGPVFSANFTAGYGLDSVTKKLQLLFPNTHSLEFINHPEKQIKITIQSLTHAL